MKTAFNRSIAWLLIFCTLWFMPVSSGISQSPARTVEPTKPGERQTADQSQQDTIRIETRLVNLNVKVTDPTGQVVVGLKPEDFEVFEDGVKQEVLHFRTVTAGLNLLLLLDLSGSTIEEREVMATATRKFIAALNPQDRIALAVFTHEFKLLADFTTDHRLVKSRVDKFNDVKGGSEVYAALWKSLDLHAQVAGARKVIVVLSDGEDDSLAEHSEWAMNSDKPTLREQQMKSRPEFEKLLARATEEAVTIYPLQLDAVRFKLKLLGGNSLAPAQSEMRRKLTEQFEKRRAAATERLQALAAQTAGTVFRADSQQDLDGVYQRVAAELRQLYSFAYAPDQPLRDGGFRKINVTVKRDGAVARTRPGYFARP